MFYALFMVPKTFKCTGWNKIVPVGKSLKKDRKIGKTRKYPLRGYILGVLIHTTALDRLWGGDETLTVWF